jgi:phosphoglycolate phosphatase
LYCNLFVFDLDGTLADTAGDLIGTLNYVLGREGLSPTPLDDARSLLGAGARALIERGLAANGASVSKARLEEMFQDFLTHYEGRIADDSRLYPGVAAALDTLEEQGGRFAVCTNKMERAAKLLP